MKTTLLLVSFFSLIGALGSAVFIFVSVMVVISAQSQDRTFITFAPLLLGLFVLALCLVSFKKNFTHYRKLTKSDGKL